LVLRFTKALVAIVLPLALLAGSIVPATASPVCAEPPRELCGGRIFPEAETALSFLQHDDGEYEAGIKALAEEFPRFVKVTSFSETRGTESLSAGGREIWIIEVTDFEARENKLPVAVSLSVHGPERAGMEGGARYAEDLARWATEEPDHELANGTEPDSTTMPVSQVLRKVHLYLTNINPDGWAQGDAANGGVFVRGNDNGVDLNREFPTMGWTKVDYTPLSEPESTAWDEIVTDIGPVTASDLHGELNSANNAYADIMLPAGQWNPLEQAREERLARHMKSNIERYFEIQGIVTEGENLRPAEYATGYDVVGYDDSGFMGDYFTERLGATEVDVEHLLSHMVPNSTWVAAHEDAHIAAVRGEIETLMVEALVLKSVRVRLRLGDVGYLFDPFVVKSADGYGGPKPPKNVDPKPYRATHMRYFKDLSRFATDRFRKVESGDVTKRKLRGLDSFVVAGDPFPRDPDGERVNKKRTTRTLKAFVKRGGNLVLTDGGLKLLAKMKVVPKSAIERTVHNAGHIDIEDFDDRYMKKVHTTASQTYYEVPLGYSVDLDTAPHVTVAREAWEGKGGKSLAYITDEARIGLGRLELGKGTIGIIGALLPRPTEEFDHFFGIADYAVTVTGGQILNNMLAYGR
jgi:hypothetical protein